MGLTPEEQAELDQLNKIASKSAADITRSNLKRDEVGKPELEAYARGVLETGTPLGPGAKYLEPAIKSVVEQRPFIQTEKELQTSLKEAEKSPRASLLGKITGYALPTGLVAVAQKGITKALETSARPLLQRAAGAIGGSVVSDVADSTTKPKSIAEIVDNAALSLGAQGAAETLTKAGEVGAKGLRKVIGATRGVPQKAIETYADNKKSVNKLITTQLRDEFLPQYADDINERIREFVITQEGQIDDVLSGIKGNVDIRPLVTAAEDEFNKISSTAFTPQIKSQANKVFDQVKIFDQLAQQGKPVSAVELNKLKKDLQDMAYNILEEGGFRPNEATKAFEALAEKARGMVNDLDPSGTIKASNKKLQQLIKAQQKLRIPNVFKNDGGLDMDKARTLLSTLPNESKGGIRQSVKEIDELLGSDIAKTSESFKAAVALEPKDLVSDLSTGKALLPLALGGAIGAVSNGGTWQDRAYGGLAGAVLGSPVMTRPAITLSKGIQNVVSKPMVKQAIGRGLYGAMKERALGESK